MAIPRIGDSQGRYAMRVAEMIGKHPHVEGHLNEALSKAIEELLSCAQVCTSCADACLGEDNVADMRQCIRLNLDCADICAAAGSVATRRTGSNEEVIQSMLRAAISSTERCGSMCGEHASMMDHCRICAESCRAAREACERALVTI